MTMLLFGLGVVVGAVAVGFLANRRPQWFAKVVAVANAVDDKAKAVAGKVS